MTETGAGRHTGVWRPATVYHLAHALYGPAALPTPPELRDHPDRRPSLGTGIAVGRAMRASCYSDRGPDHDRRRVTPRSSFPVSLAALVSTSTPAPARCACVHACVLACACARPPRRTWARLRQPEGMAHLEGQFGNRGGASKTHEAREAGSGASPPQHQSKYKQPILNEGRTENRSVY